MVVQLNDASPAGLPDFHRATGFTAGEGVWYLLVSVMAATIFHEFEAEPSRAGRRLICSFFSWSCMHFSIVWLPAGGPLHVLSGASQDSAWRKSRDT